MGLRLGTQSPERRVSVASVVFTPARGVIHPSFPLRGRWDDPCKVPSKPLPPRSTLYAYRHMKRAQRRLYMHELSHRAANKWPRLSYYFSYFYVPSVCHATEPNPASWTTSEPHQKRFWELPSEAHRSRPSSRTQVPISVAFQRYRFSSATRRKLASCPGLLASSRGVPHFAGRHWHSRWRSPHR
jgi:hypothetical protein